MFIFFMRAEDCGRAFLQESTHTYIYIYIYKYIYIYIYIVVWGGGGWCMWWGEVLPTSFPLREELPTACPYWFLIIFLSSSEEEVPHQFPPFPYCFLIRFLLTSEVEEVGAPHTISHYFLLDFLLGSYQIVRGGAPHFISFEGGALHTMSLLVSY